MQELPAIVKCAERLLGEVEQAIRSFTRLNRYDYGRDLRGRAMELVSLGTQAWREVPRRLTLLEDLVRRIDDFKTWLRLGKTVRAFASFNQFELLARITEELGRQAWRWKESVASKEPGSGAARQRGAGARSDTEFPRRPPRAKR